MITISPEDNKFYMEKYFEVVEHLLTQNPKDKDLTFSMYEGSLQNGNFSMAAKMAAKMVNAFDVASFSLPQI